MSVCQYSSTVRVGSTCTGVYVGKRIVLTAGHCSGVSSVTFGEADGGSGKHVSVPVMECVDHPDGHSVAGGDYLGPDIGYCRLAEQPPDVPVIPPMVPTGCARNWLAKEVYIEHGWGDGPPATMVGMGCSDFSSGCMPGHKRALVGKLLAQITSGGTTTKLKLDDKLQGGVGMMEGDSGGPVLIQLPDGSWRVIGVLHSASLHATFEAVPPYLNWIENRAGVDITPCHDRIGGEWVFHGECEGNLPLDPSLTGSWNNDCQVDSSALGGGEDECAGWETWWIDGSIDGEWTIAWLDQGWAPASVLVEIAVGVLQRVVWPDGSGLSLPRDEQTLRAFIIDAADPLAVDPFLPALPPSGYLPITSTAELVAHEIASFLQLPPELDPNDPTCAFPPGEG